MDECPHGLGDPAWCVACNGKAHLLVTAEAAAVAAEGARIAGLTRDKERRAAAARVPLRHSTPDGRVYVRPYGPGDTRREKRQGKEHFRFDR